jgi:outer membrane lipoprotein-sorting protein
LKENGLVETRKSRVFLLALVAVTSWISIGWADNWDQIKKAAEGIKTIEAHFVQEKHLKILSKPLISKGIFYYQAPNSLRWEYITPVRSILLMHNGKTRRFVKSQNGLFENSRTNPTGTQIILQEISMWLKGHFSDNPIFDATLEEGRKIVLTPKEKGLSKMISHIDLILSDKPGIIKSVTIYEDQDSYTRLIFTNTKINKKIREAIFQGIS